MIHMFSKVRYIYIFLFRLLSIIAYRRILNVVLCDVQ